MAEYTDWGLGIFSAYDWANDLIPPSMLSAWISAGDGTYYEFKFREGRWTEVLPPSQRYIQE